MEQEVQSYGAILIYLVMVVGFALTTLIAAHLIGPRKSTAVKDMPYESGMDPTTDARSHIDIKFYIVAILFLVFDVELLFIYPWAVTAYAGGSNGLPTGLVDPAFNLMLVFIATLALAYVYAWKKGVFEWR